MKLLLLVTGWLYSFNLAAQPKNDDQDLALQPGISYKGGLTGGLNAAQLQQVVRSGLLWQYNLGVILEQRFSRSVALAYQLLYSKQGSSTPVTGLGGEDNLINQFDYLSLPILLRLNREAKSVFLEVGGQAGYLVAGKGYFASAKSQVSTFQHIHKFDYGLTAGIGCRLGGHLVIDARYNHGLHPILADYTVPDPQMGRPTFYRVVKWYNRVWSLNLSYYL
jgi:hypothetical protein